MENKTIDLKAQTPEELDRLLKDMKAQAYDLSIQSQLTQQNIQNIALEINSRKTNPIVAEEKNV